MVLLGLRAATFQQRCQTQTRLLTLALIPAKGFLTSQRRLRQLCAVTLTAQRFPANGSLDLLDFPSRCFSTSRSDSTCRLGRACTATGRLSHVLSHRGKSRLRRQNLAKHVASPTSGGTWTAEVAAAGSSAARHLHIKALMYSPSSFSSNAAPVDKTRTWQT